MKYIDADKLIANLERQNVDKKVIEPLIRIIDSLQQEQQDVKLEDALNSLDDAYFDLDGIAVIGATHYLTVEDLKDTARYFYNLGLNARKT